ncbi:hypothetical protein TrCOL_g8187 [Triparma columacea]|uniref:Uncharacterized protein n=1 Tax=Triparma columacea TaxID=722753 RepID=A0A9W7GBU1_9STRA|nr:hypothetical protein TrCOL_g8187 [Triparma columacea]
MFSANTQLNLRASKKLVISWVESRLPSLALDAGVTVLAMEVACRDPGCVPIETCIVIVFPTPSPGDDWNEGGLIDEGIVKEGKYTTKVLKPMKDVKEEDVVASLPPELGGTFSFKNEMVKVRDFVVNQVNQISNGVEDKDAAVEFLIESLKEFKDRGYESWGVGEVVGGVEGGGGGSKQEVVKEMSSIPQQQSGGLFLPPQPPPSAEVNSSVGRQPLVVSSVPGEGIPQVGNFVIKRSSNTILPSPQLERGKVDVVGPEAGTTEVLPKTSEGTERAAIFLKREMESQIAMMEGSNMTGGGREATLMRGLEERDKCKKGVRRRGCPCCDPDDTDNVLDMMMNI